MRWGRREKGGGGGRRRREAEEGGGGGREEEGGGGRREEGGGRRTEGGREGGRGEEERTVADLGLVDLAVRLEHTKRVGDGVGNDGSGEADQSLARKFLERRVRERQDLGEVVVLP